MKKDAGSFRTKNKSFVQGKKKKGNYDGYAGVMAQPSCPANYSWPKPSQFSIGASNNGLSLIKRAGIVMVHTVVESAEKDYTFFFCFCFFLAPLPFCKLIVITHHDGMHDLQHLHNTGLKEHPVCSSREQEQERRICYDSQSVYINYSREKDKV